MISAKDALDLYEASDAAVKQFLDKLDSDIRQAACAGKRELVCGGKKLTETAPEHTAPEPSAVQAKVMAELKKARFRVEWAKTGEPFAPKGAQADGAEPSMVCTWAIHVGW